MHIVLGEEDIVGLADAMAREHDESRLYCVPTAIAEIIQYLRSEIRRHVADLVIARRLEHRLLLLESLAAAQSRGREFWSGECDPSIP
jgi:hypothetical protein